MPGIALRGHGRAYLKNGGSPAWTKKKVNHLQVV